MHEMPLLLRTCNTTYYFYLVTKSPKKVFLSLLSKIVKWYKIPVNFGFDKLGVLFVRNELYGSRYCISNEFSYFTAIFYNGIVGNVFKSRRHNGTREFIVPFVLLTHCQNFYNFIFGKRPSSD